MRRILTVLLLAEDMDDFVAGAPGGWRVHRLSGDRRREWSVSVSGKARQSSPAAPLGAQPTLQEFAPFHGADSWRITFEEQDGCVERLHLEDYH